MGRQALGLAEGSRMADLFDLRSKRPIPAGAATPRRDILAARKAALKRRYAEEARAMKDLSTIFRSISISLEQASQLLTGMSAKQ
jgi:hypothetical protein